MTGAGSDFGRCLVWGSVVRIFFLYALVKSKGLRWQRCGRFQVGMEAGSLGWGDLLMIRSWRQFKISFVQSIIKKSSC